MIYSKLLGTGHYLPEYILTNAELEQRINTSDAWIQERSGIKERRIAHRSESSSSIGLIAAERALHAAHLKAQEIELIVVATSTPDRIFPSTACLIQEKLGIKGCAAFDVNAACAGFSYALSVADQFIRAGTVQKAIVIGTEVMSRIIDWNDRKTCVLFADGAGAVVLGASSEPGIHCTRLHADGEYKNLLFTPGPLPLDGKQEPCYMQMSGNEVFKVAVTKLGQMVLETLEYAGFQPSQIDWLIPHQANLRIIQAVAKKLHLPMEKVVVTIDKQGNTSAASIPIALDVAIQDGRIKRGQLLLLESFGGGFTWGSALIQY